MQKRLRSRAADLRGKPDPSHPACESSKPHLNARLGVPGGFGWSGFTAEQGLVDGGGGVHQRLLLAPESEGALNPVNCSPSTAELTPACQHWRTGMEVTDLLNPHLLTFL